jgi:hypothetical protein
MTTRTIRDPKGITVNKEAENLRQVVIDIHQLIKPFYSKQTTAYTTSGNAGYEIVDVDSSSSITVSLHTSPSDGQQVIVKRMGSGAVTVDTAGPETIDGSASTSISAQYNSLGVIYLDSADEWVVI